MRGAVSGLIKIKGLCIHLTLHPPRRRLRSPVTSPIYWSGVTTSTFVMGSGSVGFAHGRLRGNQRCYFTTSLLCLIKSPDCTCNTYTPAANV